MTPPLVNIRVQRPLLMAVIGASAIYLGVSLWAGWEEVLLALRQVGLAGSAMALALSLVNYGLRFFRWQYYLGLSHFSPPWMASLRIYLAGFALTMTPGKAGEALRSILLARRGIPYSVTLAALVSERVADLVVFILFALLSVKLYPQASIPVAAAAACITLAIALFSNRRIAQWLSGRCAAYRGKGSTLLGHVVSILSDVRSNLRPGLLLAATLVGLVAWGAEALAFQWILGWMGHAVPLTLAIFIYAASMLAGAASMLPGGMGGAEAVMIFLLTHHGVPLPAAIAATVFIRLTTLWFAVLIGLFALILSRSEAEGE